MYKFLTKNGQTISFLVGLAITLIFLFSILGGLDEFNMMDEDTRKTSDLFNFGITAAAGLVILCTAGMIIFILLNIFTNLKGNIKLLIGLAVIAVVFFVMMGGASFEAEGTVLGNLMRKPGVDITAGQNGFIAGGIWTGLILTIGAFATFIVLEILNFFK